MRYLRVDPRAVQDNQLDGGDRPTIVVVDADGTQHPCREARIDGPSVLRYDRSMGPLVGARVFIETDSDVIIDAA